VGVLRRLATDTKGLQLVADASGVNLAVTALSTHRTQAGVVQEACGCLFNLTCAKEHQDVFVELSGPALLAKVALEFPGVAGIAAEVIGTFANLAWAEEHRHGQQQLIVSVVDLIQRCVVVRLCVCVCVCVWPSG